MEAYRCLIKNDWIYYHPITVIRSNPTGQMYQVPYSKYGLSDICTIQYIWHPHQGTTCKDFYDL